MGTYCDDAAVDSSARMIDEGCTIQLRDNENYLNPEVRPVSKMLVEFDDLSYSVCYSKGNSKKILEDVTGCFRPQRLTVIVGPSGAGKTTLLRIVSTLKSNNIKGSITVNGTEWNGRAFRKQTCFLPQEFALSPLLTTRETLYIAARLKMRGIYERRAFYLIVTEIAESLGLTNCLDTMVENLSGGERKRLAIGIEIITRPCLLLLDEPTSGLDSTSSYQVICLLHKIARGGCTVACAIHQPSSRMISQFDDLLVMHEGKSYYYGAWEDVLSTFNDANYACPQFYNICEFVLEVVTRERGGDLNHLYKINREKYLKWKTHFEHPTMGADVIVSKLDNLGNKPARSRLWQEQKILFLKAMICIKRDNILSPSIFIAITYYLTGQPMECFRFFRTWLICVLTTILGQSSGMLVGVTFSTDMGVFLIPAVNMPMILFAGFFLKFSEVTFYLQPLCAISFFRYAFEGILQSIYDGNREKLQCDEIYCQLRSPKKILEVMDMPTMSYYMTVLGLCIWIICLQVCTYLILKWKVYIAKR
ncbi:ATP-binding cassette sub-family G member 4 isoform X2 [Megachile rotundata]|uniref:ATP-binding cassette sub-family G member 4 isoform X2 n=1 Tax=Megachile rotundata TaxID=143995 RepID=UPI0006151B10|nr:PREDICTED: ATP-binding cassette sub-family G member 4-like isoform X2 [Megachile rotundata]